MPHVVSKDRNLNKGCIRVAVIGDHQKAVFSILIILLHVTNR